jgi:rod shape determining protein RodA
MQPDTGSAAVLLGLWFILLMVTGVRWRYLGVIMLTAIVLVSILWFGMFADYQKARIMTFLNPAIDPLGSGYNVTQAKIAVGSGGVFGRGLGFGSQSQLKFIPESQTDFIFAVIAEELGLLGVALVLGLWVLIFYRLARAAKRARDDFGQFVLLGILIIFFIHIFVNIGMNIGLLPVTGISLPFLSYGGSFVLVSMFFIGVAESVIASK